MLSGWTKAQAAPVLDGLQHDVWLLSLLASICIKLLINCCTGIGRHVSDAEVRMRLQQKHGLLREAHHLMLMETLQLRAYYPPLATPEDTQAHAHELQAILRFLQQHMHRWTTACSRSVFLRKNRVHGWVSACPQAGRSGGPCHASWGSISTAALLPDLWSVHRSCRCGTSTQSAGHHEVPIP